MLNKGVPIFHCIPKVPRKELSPLLEGDHCFKVRQKLRLKQHGWGNDMLLGEQLGSESATKVVAVFAMIGMCQNLYTLHY